MIYIIVFFLLAFSLPPLILYLSGYFSGYFDDDEIKSKRKLFCRMIKEQTKMTEKDFLDRFKLDIRFYFSRDIANALIDKSMNIVKALYHDPFCSKYIPTNEHERVCYQDVRYNGIFETTRVFKFIRYGHYTPSMEFSITLKYGYTISTDVYNPLEVSYDIFLQQELKSPHSVCLQNIKNISTDSAKEFLF